MPPAKKPKWERRPQRRAVQEDAGDADEHAASHAATPDTPPALKITAVERRQIYARLLWLGMQYWMIFALEASANAPLMDSLTSAFTSAHTQRTMRLDTSAGIAARQAVQTRLGDCIGFLERARNRLYVPISQVAKAIVYIASGVTTAVWVAERKARRVVGRQYAIDVLREMADCRPPPPFEELPLWLICSIGFDQTYAKASAGTGTSTYNPIQTVDASGARQDRERMVYINGQFFPVPRSALSLNDDAIARIRATGPYTQDFRRIIPLLQPYRLDGVMDGLLRRTAGLLAGQPPASTRSAMQRLLSRPNDDPGGATYLTFMPPLPNVNTCSYVDMIAIIAWCIHFLSLTPLILYLIGDGQSVLRLRDLKRLHPERYKHVLIGNGPFHSGAHSSFADVTLWWWCLLCTCMVTIGKVTVEADGTYTGTVQPGIKSLQRNATDHVQEALLAVTVAIVVFFTTKVTQPPPELFVSNPVQYISRIQNATGLVLSEFLRHSGVPTLMWQRATRGREGTTLDDLHCLALHKFRCAHKTCSSQISLLHLVSIYGTHPALRSYLRSRLFVNLTPNVGAAVGTDQGLECMNDVQKESNVSASLLQSLAFTTLIQPMQFVYRHWKIAMGTLPAANTGVRASMENEIDALVRLFVQKMGTDLETYTTHNELWHTGNPVDMRSAANLKRGRPGEWIWSVASGRSSCLKRSEDRRTEVWVAWVERHVREHMFRM
jgi:hypothetical protein